MARDLVSQIKDTKFNYLYNPAFRFTQRGDYSSNTAMGNLYYLDRWQGYITGLTAVFRRLADLPSHISDWTGMYACFVQATSSGTAAIAKRQKIADYHFLRGQTVTFSCWVRSNSSNTRLIIYDGSANHVSSPHSGNGNYEELKITATINSSSTQIYAYVGFFTASAGVVSITSGDYFTFTASQVVVGTNTGIWEPRPYGVELQLCFRYFYKSEPWGYYFHKTNNDHCSGNGTFPVNMRLHPSITLYTTSGTGYVYGFTTGANISGVYAEHVTYAGIQNVTKNGAFTTEETVMFGIIADAEL